MKLEVRNLCFRYGNANVLRQISFSADSGEVITLLGPNGAGKSTLLRCILGTIAPCAGDVLVDGANVRQLSPRALSEIIAYIPQNSSSAFPYTVLDSVLMGVTGRLRLLGAPKRAENQAAVQALEQLGIAHLQSRACNRISGGERQLMLIARAIVQRASVLLMDEPTASLDYGNSHMVMERVAALGAAGITVLFSTHQPEYALRYGTRALALQDGRLLTDGEPGKVVTAELAEQLYRIPISLHKINTPSGCNIILIPNRSEGHE